MLTAVIDWSLRNRAVVLLTAALLAAVAAAVVPDLPIDAFPDPTPVQVQVNTYAPNLSPVEVEQQITVPIERAISGLPKIKPTRSVSKFGLSQVVVTFEDGTNIYFARQLLAERLTAVEFPANVTERPQLGPVATGLGEVFHYTLSSRTRDPVELRTLQDWTLRPQLRTVPGTAEVNSWGGGERQYVVRPDPDKLRRAGVSFDEVVRAVADGNLNVGGGRVVRPGSEVLVRGVGRANTVDELLAIPVKPAGQTGVAVRVCDVAAVEAGSDLRTGAVSAMGRGEVVLGLGFTLMGENPHAVTKGLQAKLADAKTRLPPDVTVTPVYERTDLVDHVIATVRANLFEGGLLVVAVLFALLGNLRAGLIVAAAIPLSMLFAFAGMLRFGIAASLLSLGALDFGLVVDSSLVMVENVMRRIALRGDDGDPAAHRKAVRDAIVEVRGPTLFGELIIMAVYLPVLTLEGVEGKFFRPMAWTVIFALAGSLLLSLTVMPALASLVLPRRLPSHDPRAVRLVRHLYRPVLRLALPRRAAVLALAATTLLAAVVLARGLGSEFVPRLNEGALTLTVFRLPGTTLDEAVRANTVMERLLLKEFPDEVARVWARCGTGGVATDPMGPEETDLFIMLKPRNRWTKAATQDELVGKIKDVFDGLPGQNCTYTQPIEQRVNEMISGVKADVAVEVYGDDFDTLKRLGDRVVAALAGVPGCDAPVADQVTGQPVLKVKLRPAMLARHGVSARSVLRLVEAVGGVPAGDVLEGELRFPVVVRLPDAWRSNPDAIGAVTVLTPGGARVPLSDLAEVAVVYGPAKIQRAEGQRRLTVQCNVRGRDLGGFLAEARQKVAASVPLPGGRYRIAWGGQFENLQRAEARLMIAVPVALLIVLALLYLSLGHAGEVLLVFSGVPLAAVGGVAALWVRGLPFSVSAGVGFIALSGVAVLNSLVLVTFIRHLRETGLGVREAVEEAAVERLRPVLLTALVAGLGFVPMALNTGVGAEVQRPLATVVIGGIVSSTLLTLLVLPVLYHLFGRWLSVEQVAPATPG
ncbi:efflux RND transporter permease subunit [Limnoglobus roseus]|uniref:efflux RND transporter permease subunit n=1 Tax=Limnoglobus roseus TaxID=2598579 RepID=UPI0011EB333C|nr:CusA/CzcA family heavy metal efflux RND transporter [Limnoglobus roseus]